MLIQGQCLWHKFKYNANNHTNIENVIKFKVNKYNKYNSFYIELASGSILIPLTDNQKLQLILAIKKLYIIIETKNKTQLIV